LPDDIKSLVNKLGTRTKALLELSAQEAVSAGNSTIEVEHFLKCSLDDGQSAISLIIDSQKLSRSVALLELSRAIEKFPKSASRTPTFSSQLITGLREAWTAASVEFDLNYIDSGTFLYAVLGELGLKATISNASAELYKVEKMKILRDIKKISQRSNEKNMVETENNSNLSEEKTYLTKFTKDLTEMATLEKIDPVIGRDKEIHEVVNILLRRRQNNPILLGKPGVGKTAIVEGLAQKLISGELTNHLTNVRLVSLDLTLMAAGASVKGEYEKRLKGIIDEIEQSKDTIILFIDEAHSLIGAGGEAGKSDAANILKPALARGELRVIAATTFGEYKKYIEKDAALERRFQAVKVEEPSNEMTKSLLVGLAHKLEEHHSVRIDQRAIELAVELSTRYIVNRQQPDKAISVLDTACSKLSATSGSIPIEIQDLQHQLKIFEIERKRIETDTRLFLATDEDLKSADEKISFLQKKISVLDEEFQTEKNLVKRISILEAQAIELTDVRQASRELEDIRRQQNLTVHDKMPLIEGSVSSRTVAGVISDWTGIPASKLLNRPEEKIKHLNEDLLGTIFGQDHACKIVSDRMRMTAAGLHDPQRPLGVFLLVGPSGVGKTETAKALADILFLGGREMITINMSEFQEAHSVAGLRGAPPGYVGYGEGGVLTEAVKRTPHNIILLDEFEKAHRDVQEIFFQVFDEGRLDDSDGERVNFQNTLILVTSNVGSEIISRYAKNNKFGSNSMELELNHELNLKFSPALLGRMNVVPYKTLDEKVLKKIAVDKFFQIAGRLEKNFNIDVTLNDELVEILTQEALQNEQGGARSLIQLIETYILPRITDFVLDIISSDDTPDGIIVSYKDGDVRVEATTLP